MRESYLDQVIRRGNELQLLERAAASRPAGLSAAVRWAVQQSITKGTDGTHFSPAKTCTRAEIVTFLQRDAAGQGS